jgi:hypothetical protein
MVAGRERTIFAQCNPADLSVSRVNGDNLQERTADGGDAAQAPPPGQAGGHPSVAGGYFAEKTPRTILLKKHVYWRKSEAIIAPAVAYSYSH